jgi:hypothetical protein
VHVDHMFVAVLLEETSEARYLLNESTNGALTAYKYIYEVMKIDAKMFVSQKELAEILKVEED